MNPTKFIIMATSLAILTGCAGNSESPSFAPTQSSLYITSEGTVTSATVETYDNDYYSADELKSSVEEILTAFNTSVNVADAATINDCTMADGTAKLLIDFKDADSYLTFMEEYPDDESTIQIADLDITTVSDGIVKGYIAGETFTKPSDSGKSISADEVMKQSKLYVAAIEGASLIQTDGAIQYISSGVSAVGANMVETPAGQVSYVVFK